MARKSSTTVEPSRAVSVANGSGGLVNIAQAKQLLATASIEVAVDLRDKAAAMANYLKARRVLMGLARRV